MVIRNITRNYGHHQMEVNRQTGEFTWVWRTNSSTGHFKVVRSLYAAEPLQDADNCPLYETTLMAAERRAKEAVEQLSVGQPRPTEPYREEAAGGKRRKKTNELESGTELYRAQFRLANYTIPV